MADARKAVRQRLESLSRAGVTNVPKRARRASAATAEKAGTQEAVAATPSAKASTRAAAALPKVVEMRDVGPLPLADRIAALDVVRDKVSHCMRCPELCTTRKQTVFGVGNPQARLCFLGEAPGADEDAQGEPFVGRAGQLLTKIIEACTLKRSDVFIFNTLKCRPPGNRPPLPAEVENCSEYLDAQLAIIRPEFVCCLGAVAAKAFFGDEKLSISRIRGKFQTHRGVQVMCTYHPAYLLRNPEAKRDVWDDMKVLMRAMGIDLEKK